MNKKGSSIIDTFIGWAIIIGFGIGAVLAILLVLQIGGLLETSFAGQPVAQEIVTNYTDIMPSIFEWLFLILIIAIPLINLGLGILIPTNPVWYWLYIAITLPAMLLAVFAQDAWQVFISPTIIADTITALPIIAFIMDKIIYYFALLFMITGIGTYVKIKGLEVFR